MDADVGEPAEDVVVEALLVRLLPVEDGGEIENEEAEVGDVGETWSDVGVPDGDVEPAPELEPA